MDSDQCRTFLRQREVERQTRLDRRFEQAWHDFQAIVLAGLLVSYYTCLETLSLRVSQFFENDLAPEKPHQDLLRKMSLRLEVEGSLHT